MRLPSGMITTPGPLRLPPAYSPLNSASGLPFSVQRTMPFPVARPSLQPPDQVTDSFAWGSGFQILHGVLVAVIQPGAAPAWAAAATGTNRTPTAAMMALCFIVYPSSLGHRR